MIEEIKKRAKKDSKIKIMPGSWIYELLQDRQALLDLVDEIEKVANDAVKEILQK